MVKKLSIVSPFLRRNGENDLCAGDAGGRAAFSGCRGIDDLPRHRKTLNLIF
jgi:hypothetical protein